MDLDNKKPEAVMSEATSTEAQIEKAFEELKYEWGCIIPSYDRVCECAYNLWKATKKAGCKGRFTEALKEIKLPCRTAYDMVTRHKVRLGEPDPDTDEAPEEEEDDTANDSEEEHDQHRGRRSRAKKQSSSSAKSRVIIRLAPKDRERFVAAIKRIRAILPRLQQTA